MDTGLEVILIIIFSLVLWAVLLTIPVWLLWNWVAVGVLELPALTLLQAGGMTMLCSFLFKSSSSSSKS